MRLGGSSSTPGDVLAGVILFVRGISLTLGAFAVIYGACSWVFGDDLWGMIPTYGTASLVPWSPQSWGTLAAAGGFAILIGVIGRIQRALLIGVGLVTVWSMAFLGSFIIEAFTNHAATTAPPITVWSFVFLVSVHRALLAWSTRKVPGPW